MEENEKNLESMACKSHVRPKITKARKESEVHVSIWGTNAPFLFLAPLHAAQTIDRCAFQEIRKPHFKFYTVLTDPFQPTTLEIYLKYISLELK